MNQAPASSAPAKEESVKPVSEPTVQKEQASTPKPKLEFDYSSIDPEKEWECFGTFDAKSVECKECPFGEKCEVKKASKSK